VILSEHREPVVRGVAGLRYRVDDGLERIALLLDVEQLRDLPFLPQDLVEERVAVPGGGRRFRARA